MKSILLVDDHPLMREGLSGTFDAEMDLEVTGAVGSAEAALELLAEDRPDLLITDLSLEGMDGLELTRRATQRWPDLPVLMLSRHAETVYARDALQAGALGYLEKGAASEDLARAARRVARGRRYLSEEVEERLGLHAGSEEPAKISALLSARELQLFERLGRGEGIEDIAEQMGVGRKTVTSYRRRIRTKLDIESTEQVQRWAVVWLENENP